MFGLFEHYIPKFTNFDKNRKLDIILNGYEIHNEDFDSLNPHPANVGESLILRGRGKYAPQGKLAIFAVILHSRQQKTYQWTLKT